MKACFELAVLTLLLLAELLIGNIGLSFGLTAFALLYFSVTCSLGNALCAAVVIGGALDGFYGRPLLLSPLILAAAVWGGWSLRRHPRGGLQEVLLPGVLVSEIVTLGGALSAWAWGGGPPTAGGLIWELIFNGALGLLVMPAMVLALDGCAAMLNLEVFSAAPRMRSDGNKKRKTVSQRIVVPRGGRRR